nr:glycosyltransferase family 4 protein [uncultured Carboxylicivirga sp.]
MQHKTLIIWDRMGDYHRARIKAINNLLGEENVHTADLGSGDGIYQWMNTESANHHLLSNKKVEDVDVSEALANYKRIIKENQITHVCIPGYGRKAYIKMLLWSKRYGLQVLLFAESWYSGNRILDFLKGQLINRTTHVCFVSGKRAAVHFTKRLGIPHKNIIEGYSVVDNDHFSTDPSYPKGSPTLLCVARFAEEKNLRFLIKAFKSSSLSEGWKLKIVGGGPLKETLQQEINEFEQIELCDWLTYDQLPELYASSHAFILPSSFEPWGLVINEAMAAGKPVLLSTETGALPDLLEENKNGWSFNPNDDSELIESLDKLAESSPEQLIKMGTNSQNIIDNYSCQTWAQKIVEWIK